MKITTKHFIEISYQEIIDLVMSAKGLGGKVDLKITGIPEIDNDIKHESDWIEVPANWNQSYCPNKETLGTEIEVKFRDGKIEKTTFVDSFCWKQENCDYDIVAYRVVK